MKFTPRHYQITGAEFLRTRNFVMLGDAPGVGKTGQAIMALDPAWSVLVVCPASVKLQWQAALKDWRGLDSTVITNSQSDSYSSDRIVIVNYDLMIRDRLLSRLLEVEWDLVIFDEAHKLKSIDSKRTKAALSRKGLRSRAKRMWFLTGTPVKNRPVDLYPILRSCAPEVLGPYSSYLHFVYRYCGAYKGQFGLDVSGASHLEELGCRLKSFMLRREKRDVLTELPPRIISTVPMECSPSVRAIIQEEEEKTVEQAGESDPAMFKLGEQVRIRKALAKHKVPGAVEYIKDLLEEEDKIVVFYHHKEVLRELQKATEKTKSVFIDGGVSPDKRGGVVDLFIKDRDTRLFFGQMEACGEGIDGLQNGCSTAVFVEPSWSHTDLEQCIGRLERSGQKEPVNVHILTIKDTLEERMMEVVAMKLNTDKKIYQQQTKEAVVAKENKKEAAGKALLEAWKSFIAAYETEAEVPVVEKTVQEAALDVEPAAPKVVREVKPVKEADVSEEAIRARAADVCAIAPNGKGKDAVVALIKGIGGGKIADLKTPEQRVNAMRGLDELFNDLAGA